LQENKPFLIFQKLILKILDIFEKDRSTIAREMRAFYEETDVDIKAQEYADNLAKKILEESRKNKQEKDIENKNESKENEKSYDSDKIVLSQRLEDKEDEIEKLKDEQKLLRGMASSGIVIASFSHDLSKISQNLNSRIDKLKRLISQKIKEEDYKNIENRKNPFYLLERMKKQDLKLQNWLHFSLGVARKDKRKMKQLKFKSYFSVFKDDWQTVLNNRAINLKIDNIEQIGMRIFEIDIDSIFNNLLVNSIDAFNNSTIDRDREIQIAVLDREKEIVIEYQDNGTGLSKDITVHSKIFEPMFTTNVNKHTGDEEGTGLGMWLLKSIVNDNDGNVNLLYPSNGGFGIRISFPKKYTRNK
jgi:C4-dicarboxylate-specific signal transduction histidine kinase